MSRIFYLILILIFLPNCSLNENSKIWNKKEKNLKENVKVILTKEKEFSEEFNPKLNINLSNIKFKNATYSVQNNFGSHDYPGTFSKAENFKFSKFKNIEQLNFKPLFLKNGLIFFDNLGSIIRYNNEQKVLWKKNYYSKSEKKKNPKLTFARNNENLIVVDDVAKFYLININTGELVWSKVNDYPFNSQIKIFKDKFFAIDYKNIMRCFNLKDGSECWNFKTEDSLMMSGSKYSIIIENESVIFNNSVGDITAIDIPTGSMLWQIPTQSSRINNETYIFKNSKLVSDGNSIFLSNNKNQFFSISSKLGTINWTNKISSNLTPVLLDNLIFTISSDGYLFTIDKNQGNILRVNDIYNLYKSKHRNKTRPVGFSVGQDKLYLSNNDGKIIVINLSSGNVIKTEKISGGLISEPFIFNRNLFVIKNGSVIKYN